MNVQIVAHRGTGIISRLIAWFRPPYSHIEFWFPDLGVVISADAEGVVEKPLPHLSHTGTGTVVDIFEYKDPLSHREYVSLYHAAKALVGTKYDYWMLFWGFTLKAAKWGKPNKWICSGVVLKASQEMSPDRDKIRALAERVRDDFVSPRDLTRSPLLKWVRSSVIQ